MIYIEKGIEPHGLTQYRLSTPNASYDGMPTNVKDDIKNHLLNEQCFICAYCMTQIQLNRTTIEHYVPQSVERDKDLEYGNMLGVCRGNEGNPYTQQTCGSHRQNRTLTVNPLQMSSVEIISYSRSGQIKSTNAEIDYDLNETLNLNVSFLVNNRKAVLATMIEKLSVQKKTGSWKNMANKYIAKLNNPTKKTPYCGILLWYLNMKIR